MIKKKALYLYMISKQINVLFEDEKTSQNIK